MKTCPVTGRIHRTKRELERALASLDKQLEALEAAERTFGLLDFPCEQVTCDAWNAVNDAIDRLRIERSKVAANPCPMKESDRETYLLVKANID